MQKDYFRPLGTFTEIGTLPWQSNGTKTLMLNKESEVQLYKLRFEITHDNGAGAVLSVTDMFRMLKEVRITAGGRNNIKMISGIKLYLNYLKNYGITPRFNIDSTASKADAKSWVIVEIPMNMYDMKRPWDSIFPSYRFNNLDLKVTFDDKVALGSNITVKEGSITVFEDAIENFNRDDDYGFFKEIYQSLKIDSNNPKHPLTMPTGLLYKQFSFISYKDGVLSDEIIQGITVRAGSKVIKSYSVLEIKEQMRRRFGQTSEALMTGMLIVDFAERGHGTEFLDTRPEFRGFKQLTVELDVISAGGDNHIDQYSDYFDTIPFKKG